MFDGGGAARRSRVLSDASARARLRRKSAGWLLLDARLCKAEPSKQKFSRGVACEKFPCPSKGCASSRRKLHVPYGTWRKVRGFHVPQTAHAALGDFLSKTHSPWTGHGNFSHAVPLAICNPFVVFFFAARRAASPVTSRRTAARAGFVPKTCARVRQKSAGAVATQRRLSKRV